MAQNHKNLLDHSHTARPKCVTVPSCSTHICCVQQNILQRLRAMSTEKSHYTYLWKMLFVSSSCHIWLFCACVMPHMEVHNTTPCDASLICHKWKSSWHTGVVAFWRRRDGRLFQLVEVPEWIVCGTYSVITHSVWYRTQCNSPKHSSGAWIGIPCHSA